MEIKEVDKLSADKAFAYIMTILALIVPGIGNLFISKYSLFLTMPYSKIILLSIFYSIPIYLISFYIVLRSEIDSSLRKDPFVEMVTGISLYVLISFFLGVGLHYGFSFFLMPNLELMTYVYVVLALMLIVSEFSRMSANKKKVPKAEESGADASKKDKKPSKKGEVI